ncbi:MAG: TolB protein [Woeseiaceae bacterium]|jgi:TolB protein
MKILSVLLAFLIPATASSQWTNQYPKVDGYGHHVYLEGYELPIMNAGPMDPAPSPAGSQLAFSARGWLWLLDLQSGNAQRITDSAGMDSRPEWSPDGSDIVFIRDSGSQLGIVSINVASGEERILVDVEAINLDPVFSLDEKFVYYSSAESGALELWRVSLDTLHREQVTTSSKLLGRPLKRRPLILAQDSLLLYLTKYDGRDIIEILNTLTQTSVQLLEDRTTAQADMSLSPDRRFLAYTWPYDGGHELRLMSISAPDTSILLTQSLGMPLAPAFSHDGEWIYFAEANDDERTELKRISANGGPVETVNINNMDWGTDTGTLSIKSTINRRAAAVRMNVLDASGHPVIPERGTVRSEGQNGRVFFYSDGTIELTAPAGKVTVSAVQGFETSEVVQEALIRRNETTSVTLDLDPVWDASKNGWYSADTHFHLNYGGTYRLDPEDIVTDLKGEGLDVAFPLLANLHNRFLQEELWGWSYDEGPIIQFGQEIRPHFLGHVMQLGSDELFWPWIWGPGYQVYGDDDRTNATALRHAREHGGIGGYVHPVGETNPFTPESASSIPIGFVADAVLGEIDILEVVCLWSDEKGTAALWHNVLNIGIPLAASAGSDVMNDYYRTMAIGATRVYVNPDGRLSSDSYLRALKAGKSFVSNGPMLEFEVDGKGPGEAIETNSDTVNWTANVHSAMPFDSVEIYVNGTVVETFEGSSEAGSKSYQGSLQVPDGGWVTARVLGENPGWPALDSYLYAESSPVWFTEIGSTDPSAARQSAQNLLMVLDIAEKNLRAGYGNAPIPNLLEHFEKARTRLQALSN